MKLLNIPANHVLIIGIGVLLLLTIGQINFLGLVVAQIYFLGMLYYFLNHANKEKAKNKDFESSEGETK